MIDQGITLIEQVTYALAVNPAVGLHMLQLPPCHIIQTILSVGKEFKDVLDVQMCGDEAIEWPRLDVDLEIDSLRYPERYPLLIKRTPSEMLEA